MSGATFDKLYEDLTTKYGFPVLPAKSPKPYDASLSHTIAEMSIHPTLEAVLHILNSDLPSAHFLCRHMQNKPAYEAMFIHGLLHRVEGDLENTKAWYGDVAESDCFKRVWPDGYERACAFLDDLKKLRGDVRDDELRRRLLDESRREIGALVEWCKDCFGVNRVIDASNVWVEPGEKEREIAAKMIVGGEGWRQF